MALFKISKGKASNLPSTYNEGYCYVTTDEYKMYIDLSDEDTGRICLNANKADEAKVADSLSCGQIGSSTVPVFFDSEGTPVTCSLQYPIDWFKKGIAISSGADLNSFMTTGKYYCNSTSLSSTLLNSPVTNDNFVMYVFARTSSDNSSLNQMIITLNSALFIRGCASDNSWCDWRKYSEDSNLENYLPLSAGESKKLTGPLGLTAEIGYGQTLPSAGFDGQLFFLEDSGAVLPSGGSTGNALIKNSATDGDASWQSSQISWVAGTSAGPKPKIFGVEGYTIPIASTTASGVITTGEQTFAGAKTFNNKINANFFNSTTIKGGSWIAGTHEASFIVASATTAASGQYYQSWISGKTQSGAWSLGALSGNEDLYFVYGTDTNYSAGTNSIIQATRIEASTGRLYGAAWNDYAEYRAQKEKIEPGYCVASANNGKVYKTTEKFQACDGIVSDTFGFAIGETDECRTPLAVAGRVLAYCEGNRDNYQAGDTVCAGPEGKVCKMTREEIKEYPDRVIGIVSEIPEYERWGTGNVSVNGRIWIKVK